MQKKKKNKQIETPTNIKLNDEHLGNQQSFAQILQLLQLSKMKNCLMIISNAQKISENGCNAWYLENKHSIIFFPQIKQPQKTNVHTMCRYHMINWNNLPIKTVNKVRQMNPKKKSMLPFVVVKNVFIKNIRNLFSIYDQNEDKLYYFDENQVIDIDDNIRPLKDTDTIKYSVVCDIFDGDINNNLLVTALDSAATLLFGENAKTAYMNHNSISFYKNKYEHIMFHFVLKPQLIETKFGKIVRWYIIHKLDLHSNDNLIN